MVVGRCLECGVVHGASEACEATLPRRVAAAGLAVPKRGKGRPAKAGSLTAAERARAYRERKKQQRQQARGEAVE